jgi:hypothetical protein
LFGFRAEAVIMVVSPPPKAWWGARMRGATTLHPDFQGCS